MSAEEIAKRLVSKAVELERGAEVIGRVRSGRRQNTRFAANDLTTSGASDDDEISLTVAIASRHATVRTNQSDDASLVALAKRAVEMAKLAPVDPEWMPVLGAHTPLPSANAFDARTRDQHAGERADAARSAIELGKKAGVTVAGYYESGGHTRSIATSAGFVASFDQSDASLTVTARAPDGTGSGWAGAADVSASAIDGTALASIAIDKATRSRAPRALDPGRYDVVLEPAAVAELLGFLIDALDARPADEGRSFFSRKGKSAIGEKLFSPGVTFRSDPNDPLTPSAPFDDEGNALSPRTWIDRGALAELRCGRFWAHKNGRAATGEHTAYRLTGGTASGVEELVRTMKRGLVVTRFWYCRWLDPKELMVTGLTRDGVFLVEDGKITAPVNNFRFNESPARVLANVIGMTTREVRTPGGVMRVPAVATSAFNMASVSAAV